MISLLIDEDFNARIVRGVLRLAPGLDVKTVHEVGLAGQPDEVVIEWAAGNQRVLLTHDVNTMIDAAIHRLRSEQSMTGVIAVPQYLAIGLAVADLHLIVTCAEPSELAGQIWYLPL